MQESGVAFLRKYSEAARHSKSIKASYVAFWFCALITLATLAGLLIVNFSLVIKEKFEGNRTAT
jgi:hypothetical protein